MYTGITWGIVEYHGNQWDRTNNANHGNKDCGILYDIMAYN